MVGGGHWAAATWRYLPNDFRLHSIYGVGRDWPIGYDDPEPYYYRAEVELGVSGPNDGTDLGSPRAQPYPMDHLPLSHNDRRFTEVLDANGLRVVSEPVARNSRPYDGAAWRCPAAHPPIASAPDRWRRRVKVLPRSFLLPPLWGGRNHFSGVMAGLVPAIHALLAEAS